MVLGYLDKGSTIFTYQMIERLKRRKCWDFYRSTKAKHPL
jgi:hypothetical protein